MSPRSRDRAATRQALLDAARRRFAERGFDGVRVKDVAADAGVDAALVFRYFGSKAELFEEASAQVALGGPPEELPGRLVRALLDGPGAAAGDQLLALLRSADHEDVQVALRRQLCEGYLADLAGTTDAPDADLRAELTGALLVGIGVLRSVVGTPHLAAAEPDDVVPLVEAMAAAVLPRPAPGSSA